MKEVGDKVSKGLKEWVNEGICPPELLGEMERTIRAMARPRWWQRWPVVAAAAVVLLLIVAGTQQDLPGEIASLPLVGSFVTQFWEEDETGFAQHEGLGTDEHDGVAFRVLSLETEGGRLRIACLVRGNRLNMLADPSSFTLTVQGAGGPLEVRPERIVRRQGEVLLEANLDAGKVGDAFTVTLPSVPLNQVDSLTGGGAHVQKGPWQVRVTR